MELAMASCSVLPHAASTCHCPAPELCVAPNCFQRQAWTPGLLCWAWLSCQAAALLGLFPISAPAHVFPAWHVSCPFPVAVANTY